MRLPPDTETPDDVYQRFSLIRKARSAIMVSRPKPGVVSGRPRVLAIVAEKCKSYKKEWVTVPLGVLGFSGTV